MFVFISELLSHNLGQLSGLLRRQIRSHIFGVHLKQKDRVLSGRPPPGCRPIEPETVDTPLR